MINTIIVVVCLAGLVAYSDWTLHFLGHQGHN